jgi:hypothetical protein
MRDCRDVIMLAKPGYIYVVTNGGKNGSGKIGGGKKVAGRKRREEIGGKKLAGRKRREDREEMAGRRGGKRGSAERGGKRGPTNF